MSIWLALGGIGVCLAIIRVLVHLAPVEERNPEDWP